MKAEHTDKIAIFRSILDDVFNKTYNKACYVFLCGGSGPQCMRNKIRFLLEKKDFQVLYPEDLFMDMMNRNKKSNLLEYENILADNADVVCVICESFGSVAELGAFAQNDRINQKMVVCINRKYYRNRSFIMLGPVRYLKKVNTKQCVIRYVVNDLDSLATELCKEFRRFEKRRVEKRDCSHESFNMLSAYITFIPLVVFFYQTIPRGDLHKTLKELLKKRDEAPATYNELFNSAIKYLSKSGRLNINFDIDKQSEVLSLSHKGYVEIANILDASDSFNRTKLHDKIRCAILSEQLCT